MLDRKCIANDMFLSSEGLQCGNCGWSERCEVTHQEWINRCWEEFEFGNDMCSEEEIARAEHEERKHDYEKEEDCDDTNNEK